MVDLAEVMSKGAVGKAKDFAGGVADNLGQKDQAAHDAVYKGLKNDTVPPRPGFNDDGEFSLNPSGQYGGENLFSDDPGTFENTDSGPSGGGITDPTATPIEPAGEAFNGISEPTLPSRKALQPTENPQLPNVPHEASSKSKEAQSSKRNFQQSIQQMNHMNQQMQQAGQRMQGQSHIKGAEIEENDS